MSNKPKILCICNQLLHTNLHNDLLNNNGATPIKLENYQNISILEKVNGLIICNTIQSSLNDSDTNILQNNIFSYAFNNNLPLVAISQGMLSLNDYLKKPECTIKPMLSEMQLQSETTEAFITPGSRLAKTLGTMGIIKVSLPQIPTLTENQKSNSLLTSAYSTKNRSVLAFESMFHTWILGILFDLNSSEKINTTIYKIHRSLINKIINQ